MPVSFWSWDVCRKCGSGYFAPKTFEWRNQDSIPNLLRIGPVIWEMFNIFGFWPPIRSPVFPANVWVSVPLTKVLSSSVLLHFFSQYWFHVPGASSRHGSSPNASFSLKFPNLPLSIETSSSRCIKVSLTFKIWSPTTGIWHFVRYSRRVCPMYKIIKDFVSKREKPNDSK